MCYQSSDHSGQLELNPTGKLQNTLEREPQSYPTQEARELGHLYTNSTSQWLRTPSAVGYELLLGGVIPWHFWPVLNVHRWALVIRESPQAKRCGCEQLKAEPQSTEMGRVQG